MRRYDFAEIVKILLYLCLTLSNMLDGFSVKCAITSSFLDKIGTVGDVYFQRRNCVVVSNLIILEVGEIFGVIVKISLHTCDLR